jgi:hypothetical protein
MRISESKTSSLFKTFISKSVYKIKKTFLLYQIFSANRKETTKNKENEREREREREL